MKEQLKKFGAWLMASALAFAGVSAYAETVAKIGDNEYKTLKEAFLAANADDTVVLVANTTEGFQFPVKDAVTVGTLDLNGYTLTGQEFKATDKAKYPCANAAISLKAGEFTVIDGSSAKTGTIRIGTPVEGSFTPYAIDVVDYGATLNIEGGVFVSSAANAAIGLNDNFTGEELKNLEINISGGTFTSEGYPTIDTELGYGIDINVTGGDFSESSLTFLSGEDKSRADIVLTGGIFNKADEQELVGYIPTSSGYDFTKTDYRTDSVEGKPDAFRVRACDYVVATTVSTAEGEKPRRFESLKEAINDAVVGTTVSLIKDCGADESFEFSKGVTIDFKEHVYAGSFVAKGGAVVLTNGTLNALVENAGATLTIAAGATLSGTTALKVTSGAATLDGGAITGTGGIALDGGDLYFKSAYEGAIDATNIGTGLVKKDKEVFVSADKDNKYFWEEGETFDQLKLVVAKVGEDNYSTVKKAFEAADKDPYKVNIIVADKDPESNPPTGYAVNGTGYNLDFDYGAVFANGDGTVDRPFEIPDAEIFRKFRNLVNLDLGCPFTNKYVKLTGDIELGGEAEEWVRIGPGVRRSEVPENTVLGSGFGGTFDGQGHAITGLKISTGWAGDVAAGLFGYVYGTVKNFTVTADINLSDGAGTGIAVGYLSNGGKVEGVTTYGKISTKKGLGGIASSIFIKGSIVSCTNYAEVITTGGNVGGITGKAFYTAGNQQLDDCVISNCVNYGNITATQYAGGIAGLSIAAVRNCVNNGKVTVSSGDSVGGIVGNFKSGEIVNCVNNGKVDAANATSVGGIVGRLQPTGVGGSEYPAIIRANICGNVNNADVLGKSDTGAGGLGGIVGRIENTQYIVAVLDNENNGTVKDGNAEGYGVVGCVGSMLGENAWEVANNVSTTSTKDKVCVSASNDYGSVHDNYTAWQVADSAGKKFATVEYGISQQNGTSDKPLTLLMDVAWTNAQDGVYFNLAGYDLEVKTTVAGKLAIASSEGNLAKVVLVEPLEKDAADGFYMIGDLDDLKTWRAMLLNGASQNGSYKLTADIDMAGWNWQMIDNFGGTFDGKGYKISNLKIYDDTTAESGDDPNTYGFIKRTAWGAKIQNVTFVNVNLEAEDCVAAIVGHAEVSTITNCQVLGGTVKARVKQAAGLVGLSNCSKFDGCVVSNLTVTAGADGEAGGFVAQCSDDDSDTVIKNSKIFDSNISVTGTTKGSAAAICGGVYASSSKTLTVEDVDVIRVGVKVADGEWMSTLDGTYNFVAFRNDSSVNDERVVLNRIHWEPNNDPLDEDKNVNVIPSSSGMKDLVVTNFWLAEVWDGDTYVANSKTMDFAEAIAAATEPAKTIKINYNVADSADGVWVIPANVKLQTNGYAINYVAAQDCWICDRGGNLFESVPFGFAGHGAKADPYLIETPADLKKVADFSTMGQGQTFKGIYLKLANNIDLSDYDSWPGIGMCKAGSHVPVPEYGVEAPFMGCFDGNGCEITGLKGSGNNYGLFRNIYRGAEDGEDVAVIKNLTIRGTVNAAGVDNALAGGLVGVACGGTIENVTNYVNLSVVETYGRVGGIVGETFNGGAILTIKDCVNYGKLAADPDFTANFCLGGIIADCSENIHIYNCSNYGSIDGISGGSKGAGGIIGMLKQSSTPVYGKFEITGCCNYGVITGHNGGNIGGIIGKVKLNGGAGNQDYKGDDALVGTFGNLANYGTVCGTAASGGKVGDIFGAFEYASAYNFKVDEPIVVREGSQMSGVPDDKGMGEYHGFMDLKVTASGEVTVGEEKIAVVYYHKDAQSAINQALADNAKRTIKLLADYNGDFALNRNVTIVLNGFQLTGNVTSAITGRSPITFDGKVVLGLAMDGDIFQIEDEDDLILMAEMVNTGYESFAGKTVVLANDITCATEWNKCIGDGENIFKGTFDGNDKTIRNLTVNGDGLFLEFPADNSVTVSNVTFDHATINNQSGEMASVVVGRIRGGKLSNVTVLNSIVNGGKYVGALAAHVSSLIENCTVSNCTVSGSANGCRVGGAVGFLICGGIVDCVVDKTTVKGADLVGGLLGRLQVDSGNVYTSTLSILGNEVAATVSGLTPEAKANKAGGLFGEFMGNCDQYVVENNYIDVELDGTTENAIAVLGSNSGTFPTSLAANVTGNWWTDETLNADSFDYSVDPVQTIYRGVALVGETPYPTVEEAVAAAAEGGTVTMICNLTLRHDAITLGKAVTLDLDGKTITTTVAPADDVVPSAVVITGNGVAITNGSIKATAGANGILVSGAAFLDADLVVTGGVNAVTVADGASLAISGGTYGCTVAEGATAVINNGTVEISGGTFDEQIVAGGYTISGGKFIEKVPLAWCADAYLPTEEPDEQGYWSVYRCYARIVRGETIIDKYDTLKDAFTAAQSGDVIEFFAGTYDTAAETGLTLAGKEVTLRGLDQNTTILDMGRGTNIGVDRSSKITVENMTLKFDHTGAPPTLYDTDATFRQPGSQTFRDVTIVGQILNMDDTLYERCTFTGAVNDKDEYLLWCYGCTATLKDCTFTGNGKKAPVKLFNQGMQCGLIVINTTFKDTTSGKYKCAIYSSNDHDAADTTVYEVSIDENSKIEDGDSPFVISSAKGLTALNPTKDPETGKYTGGEFLSAQLSPAEIVEKAERFTQRGYEPKVDPDTGKVEVQPKEPICEATISGELKQFKYLDDAIDAVPAGTPTTIKMIADETIKGAPIDGHNGSKNTLLIPADKDITLDLDGHTITGCKDEVAGNFAFIGVKGNLTINDSTGLGKIVDTPSYPSANNGYGSYTIQVVGGNLTLNNGTIENLGERGSCVAVEIGAYHVGGSMTMNGGYAIAKAVAIRIHPNFGDDGTIAMVQANPLRFTMKGGYVMANTGIKYHNGASQYSDTEMNISGGKIEYGYAGVYSMFAYAGDLVMNISGNVTIQPVDDADPEGSAIMTWETGKLSASHPTRTKNEIKISGGTFVSSGATETDPETGYTYPTACSANFYDKVGNDAITITGGEFRGYFSSIESDIAISDGHFAPANNQDEYGYFDIYKNYYDDVDNTISISGGVFDYPVSVLDYMQYPEVEPVQCVTGGTFIEPAAADYLQHGYRLIGPDEDERYSVQYLPVALTIIGAESVTTNYFLTMNAAFAGIDDSATAVITLDDDVGGSEVDVEGQNKDITINLNGYNFVMTNEVGAAAFVFDTDNTVVVSNGTIAVAENVKTAYQYVIENLGDLELVDVTVDGSNLAKEGVKCYALACYSGRTVLDGTTKIIEPDGENTVALNVFDDAAAGGEGVAVVVANSTVDVGSVDFGGNREGMNKAILMVPAGYDLPAPAGYFWIAKDNSTTVKVLAKALEQDGSGAYLIKDLNDLLTFNLMVHSNYRFVGETVKLCADLDMAGITTFKPIDTVGISSAEFAHFKGTFDGDNHVISNFTLTYNDYGAAFFGHLGVGSTVKNVTFDRANVASTKNMAAIVAGYAYNNVTLQNVKVTNSTVAGSGKVGAIVGHSADPSWTLVFTDCQVANTTIKGTESLGALCGISQNKVAMSGNDVADIQFVLSGADDYVDLDTYAEKDGVRVPVKGKFAVYGNEYYPAKGDFYTDLYYDGWSLPELTIEKGTSCTLGYGLPHDYVAEVRKQGETTGKKWGLLEDAVKKAEAGDTVVLLDNCSGNGLVIDKNITLDFGKFTYTVENNLVAGDTDSGIAFQIAANVVISNGTLTAANAATLLVADTGANLVLTEGLTLTNGENKVALAVNAAEVLVDAMDVTVIGTVTYDGGSLTVPNDYFGITVDGYTWSLPGEDGYKTLVPAVWNVTTVEPASTTNYYSFADAHGQALDGATITLISATNITEDIEIAKNLTVDFGGKTLTGDVTLTTGEVTLQNGTINGDVSNMGATLTLTCIALNGQVGNGAGTTTLGEGTVVTYDEAIVAGKSGEAASAVIVAGATITGGITLDGGDLALNSGEVNGQIDASGIGDALITRAASFDEVEAPGYWWTLKYGRYELAKCDIVATVTKEGAELQEFYDLAAAFDYAKNDSSAVVTLVDDVDLVGVDWKPVSNFAGTFDGDNHSVSNLCVSNNAVNYAGFFGNSKGAIQTVKDITFANAQIFGQRGAVVFGGGYQGLIADNVKVLNSKVVADQKAGGLAGYVNENNLLKIANCLVENLTLRGSDDSLDDWDGGSTFGGLVGFVQYGVSGEITGNTVRNITFERVMRDSFFDQIRGETDPVKWGYWSSHPFIAAVLGYVSKSDDPAQHKIILAGNKIEGSVTITDPVQDQLHKSQSGNEYIGYYVREEEMTDSQQPVPIYIDGVCLENRCIAKIYDQYDDGTVVTNWFYSLTNAIAKAKTDDTIILQKDIYSDGFPPAYGIEVPGGKNFTLDFNNKVYAFDDDAAFALDVGSTLTFANGTITNLDEEVTAQCLIDNAANLTLVSMKLAGETVSGDVIVNTGTLTLGEGTEIDAGEGVALTAAKTGDGASSITVNGATITGGITLAGGDLALQSGTLNGEIDASGIGDALVWKTEEFEAPDPAGYHWLKRNGRYELVQYVEVAEVTRSDGTSTKFLELAKAFEYAGTERTDVTVRLLTDVNLAGVDWTPIANFSGIFDGDNHTISYLTVSNVTKSYQGLFCQVKNGATIKDVTFDNAWVYGVRSAVVVGSPYGCTVTNVTVQNSTVIGDQKCGGIFGMTAEDQCTIKVLDCHVSNLLVKATADADRHSDVTGASFGGLIGFLHRSSTTTVERNTVSNIRFEGLLGEDYYTSHAALYYQYLSHAFIGAVMGKDAGVVTLNNNTVEQTPGLIIGPTTTEYMGFYYRQDMKNITFRPIYVDGVCMESRCIAKIDETMYFSLTNAIANVGAGETIVLQETVYRDGFPPAYGIEVPGGKNFTLDFKNKVYAFDDLAAFELDADSAMTFANGTITNVNDDAECIIQNNGAALVLVSMNLAGQTVTGSYVLDNVAGSTALTDGTVVSGKLNVGKLNDADVASVVVDGATVNGNIDLNGGNLALTSGELVGDLKVAEGITEETLGNVNRAQDFVGAPPPAGWAWNQGDYGRLVSAAAQNDRTLKYYASIELAFAEAEANDTVVMLRDRVGAVTLEGKSGILDLNGCVITNAPGTRSGSTLTLKGESKLTIKDSKEADLTGGIFGPVAIGVYVAVDTTNSLTIESGRIMGVNVSVDYLKDYWTGGKTGTGELVVSGGYFKGTLHAWADDVIAESLTGGTYTVEPKPVWIATDYQKRHVGDTALWEVCYDWRAKVYNADGTFGGEYKTLAEAVAAATEDQTVVMLKDGADLGELKLAKGVTLDGKGTNDQGETKVYTLSGNTCVKVDPNGGTVQNVSFKDIHYNPAKANSDLSAIYAISLANGATVTVKDCSFDSIGWDAIQVTPLAGAKVVINGNVFRTSKPQECTMAHRYIHVQSDKTQKPTDFSITATGNKFYNCDVLNQTGFEVYFPEDAGKVNLTHNFMDAPMAVCIGTGDSYNNASHLVNPMVDADGNEVYVVAQFDDDGNNRLFFSLANAIEAMPAGGTIQLLSAAALADGYALDKALTLDLNGQELDLGAAEVGADVTIVDTAAAKGKLNVNGVISVAENVTLDVNGLGYGETGLVAGKEGSLAIDKDGNVKLMSVWANVPVNSLNQTRPGFIVPVNGAIVTLDKPYTWSDAANLFLAGDEVAVTTTTYLGKTFKQGYATLAGAVTNANADAEIDLVADAPVTALITVNKNLVLNMNGMKIDGGSIAKAFLVVKGATLTVNGDENSQFIGRFNVGEDATSNGGLVLNGGSYGVTGNTVVHVDGDCDDSNVTIKDAVVVSDDDNGVQFCGDGVFFVTNSTIKGATAIYQKSGDLTVIDSLVEATAEERVDTAPYGNGAKATGDAIVIEAMTGNYIGGAKLTVKGATTITSTAGYGIFEAGCALTPTEGIVVRDGTFNSPAGTTNIFATTAGVVKLYGGKYTAVAPEEYCAPGCIPTYEPDEDGYYWVVGGDFVARVKETQLGYTTLALAAAAATEGQTIELLADVTDAGSVYIAKRVTLDGCGFGISGDSSIYVNAEGGTVKNVHFADIHYKPAKANTDRSAIYGYGQKGTMTVENCTFDSCGWDAVQATPVKDAILQINNNVFKTSKPEECALAHRYIHIQSDKNIDFSITANGNKFHDCGKLGQTAFEVYYPADPAKVNLKYNYMDAPMAVCIGTGTSYNNASDLVNPMIDAEGDPVNVVAQFDENGNKRLFTSLEAAIAAMTDAVPADKTIQLLSTATLPEAYAFDEGLTLDLNGQTLTLGAATVGANVAIVDTAAEKGKLYVEGLVTVAADTTLDISNLGYGEKGLVRGRDGQLSIAAGGNVVVPEQFNEAPVNYLAAGSKFLEPLAEGVMVTKKFSEESSRTYTWNGTMFRDDAEVAVTTTTYPAEGGVTFQQGYDTLQAAVDAANEDATITMVAGTDVTATGVVFPAGKTLTLDLNGQTIKAGEKFTNNIRVFGNLTLKDSNATEPGKIYTEEAYSGVANMGVVLVGVQGGTGAVFTMESGVIEAVIDSTVGNGQFGINVKGTNTVVNLNGGTIRAGYYALTCNGNETGVNQDVRKVTIEGATLVSTADYAIYWPNLGTVEVAGGLVDGAAGGISANKGKIVVSGGIVTSRGTGSTGEGGDGTSGQGNAAINVNAGYGATTLEVTGGKVLAYGDADMIVSGDDGFVAVSGGWFSHVVPEDFCADGYVPVYTPAGEEDLYTVVPGEFVARNEQTTKGYTNLVEAAAAAESGEIVSLLENLVDVEEVTLPEGVTLNGAGFALSGNSVVRMDNGGTVSNLTFESVTGSAIVAKPAAGAVITVTDNVFNGPAARYVDIDSETEADFTVTVTENAMNGATTDGAINVRNFADAADIDVSHNYIKDYSKVSVVAADAADSNVNEKIYPMYKSDMTTEIPLPLATIKAGDHSTFYTELAAAFAAAEDGQTVTLLKSGESATGVELAANAKSVTLDVGTFTYAVTDGDFAISVANGWSLAIVGTGVISNATGSAVETVDGGFVALDGATLSGATFGLYVENGGFDIEDGNVSGTYTGIGIWGDEFASATTIRIGGGTISGGDYALYTDVDSYLGDVEEKEISGGNFNGQFLIQWYTDWSGTISGGKYTDEDARSTVEDCLAEDYITVDLTGEDPYKYMVKQGDPLPVIPDAELTDDKVAEVLAGAADELVKANVNKSNYKDFQQWAHSLVGKTSQEVYASDYAWYSYVLDQATLLETEPTLETTAFVMTAEGGEITVEAKAGEVELTIGANARIPVTGTDALNDTAKPFEKENVEIGEKTQNGDGTLTIKVQPNHEIWEDKPAQFFFKSALQ